MLLNLHTPVLAFPLAAVGCLLVHDRSVRKTKLSQKVVMGATKLTHICHRVGTYLRYLPMLQLIMAGKEDHALRESIYQRGLPQKVVMGATKLTYTCYRVGAYQCYRVSRHSLGSTEFFPFAKTDTRAPWIFAGQQ
jgi:hypothetical protein